MTGTFRAYREANFRPEKMALIGRIAAILDRAEARGEVYSVRQVFYQMVQANVLPNSQRSYDQVQSAIADGRMAGLLSWTAIEDRERNLMGLPTHADPWSAVRTLGESYRLDLWADQPVRPEVWVEKLALVGVVGRIANQLRVDFFGCKGYASASEVWAAGQRFADYVSKGQRPVVLHLGDHDPSGLDMTRDNRERLELFAGVPVQVVRLALNYSQVEELRLPPNPAKLTDARAADYVRQYGRESWELDALDNDHIRSLIQDAVLRLRDPDIWDRSLAQEVEDRRELERMARAEDDDDDE